MPIIARCTGFVNQNYFALQGWRFAEQIRSVLLTNLDGGDKGLYVTITKVYLMRWRVEEYYRFKKQGFKASVRLIKIYLLRHCRRLI